MSQTPPVPAANTSPYPRQEPPHVHDKAAAPAKAAPTRDEEDGVTLGWPVIAGAVAIGAGLIGSVLYALSGSEAKASKGKRRKSRH